VWQSVSVSEVVVCWTDGGWRLGDGVSWRMGRRWRQIVVLEAAPATSSIIKIYHWFMVDKLVTTVVVFDSIGESVIFSLNWILLCKRIGEKET